MRHTTTMTAGLLGIVMLCSVPPASMAQSGTPPAAGENAPAEKFKEPPPTDGLPQPAPSRPGDTLSDKLDRSNGVVRPPTVGVDPGIQAPVPDGSIDPKAVIPPPHSEDGSGKTLVPK